MGARENRLSSIAEISWDAKNKMISMTDSPIFYRMFVSSVPYAYLHHSRWNRCCHPRHKIRREQLKILHCTSKLVGSICNCLSPSFRSLHPIDSFYSMIIIRKYSRTIPLWYGQKWAKGGKGMERQALGICPPLPLPNSLFCGQFSMYVERT